ncbi:MAG: histidine kinase [Burkholderiaceae bacterium]|nr:histidine kinase [Burkholderiaceae bacterium]
MTPHGRGNLFSAWVYSAAIGTLCWFFIDGGRLLLARWLPASGRAPGERRARWPGPRWMLLCILAGTALGYSLGSQLGDAVTGFTTPSLLENRPALAISIIAAIAATWYFYATERLRIEQASAEAARRAAAESQLRLLQSQLEPHMLFNTLANLRVLVTLDPPRAQAMLDRLIGWLRATLGASRSELHPLAAEFALLDDYLALMALRMGPRLQVQLDLPEALRDLPVPPLLLQPLVENSIRHGLEPQVAGGRIEVHARRQDQRLLLTVRDTGVGLPASQPGAGGFGTSHVHERLHALFGERATFRIGPAADADGGTLAELTLPLPTLTA